MFDELRESIKTSCKKLFSTDIEPELIRPDEQFGDYATNAALQLAKHLDKNPREVAEALAGELKNSHMLKDVQIAGPGFLNFILTDDMLAKAAATAADLPKPLAGQEILVEFGDPNPFKEMHIGHLYSYVVGDAISSLLGTQGADVKRLSYHGDVGRHVAIAIYGLRNTQGQHTDDDKDFLGAAYAYGYEKFENDPEAKTEIEKINQHIYAQDNADVNELHKKGVTLSFEHFDKILNKLSILNAGRYFESQSTPIGMKLVEENVGKVFTKSQGAVVYEGEKAGLHTRVFITSKNLPTYETKDLGLAKLKDTDFPDAARSIVITANEQSEYFKVMLAALSEIEPELAGKTTHIAHGFVNLSTGKMSSRTGDVYSALTLIKEVEEAASQQFADSDPANKTAVAALKYDFLKSRLGGNITFNVEESVSLEGNSGPYLQYAHARAQSIIAKSKSAEPETSDIDASERSLARKISEYPEIVDKAATELMPHHISTYLYELAQTFNSFYEKSRIIDDPREALRTKLVKNYAKVLRNGLGILGIEAPNKM